MSSPSLGSSLTRRLRDVTTRLADHPFVTRRLRLLLSLKGRVPRATFWYATLGAWAAFVVLFLLFETAFGRASTLLLYPPLLWAVFAVSGKRYHDRDKSARWLLLLLVPIIGPLWVAFELGFRRGKRGENRFGADPTGSRPGPVAIGLAA
jgi:uncharacterized membrane protein YhaH (DUF805 family)